MSTTPMTTRRRSAEGGARRWNLTVVLAVLLPLVTLGASLLVRPGETVARRLEPAVAPLDRADRVCPTALRGGGSFAVASSQGRSAGQVELRATTGNGEPTQLDLPSGGAASGTSAGPVVVTGRDAVAPGLLATRFGADRLAAVTCPPPVPETWFTGLGARAEHASLLELVNPDVGAAVVDVAVFTRQGSLSVPDLRGIRIPGRTTTRLDLATVVPRRGDIALAVSVSRGRAVATVLDRVGLISSEQPSQEWFPAQAAPAAQVVLLGLPAGTGARTLSIANPGDSEVRVQIKVVAPESVFAPTGLDEVDLGPGGLETVQLDEVLAREVRRGAVGLLVEASAPVTASLTSYVDGDLAVTGPGPAISGKGAAIVPEGSARVVLAQASGSGTATVVSRDAAGRELGTETVEVTPGRAFVVDLPRGAAVVALLVERATLEASVVVSGRSGAVVLPFTAPQLVGQVPDVAPALP